MKQRIIKIKKLTMNKWLNLFRVQYINSKNKVIDWFFVSRKKEPITDKSVDAVVIIPIINTPEGRKLVVTKEYRVTIGDYEYGFPAGLIENGSSMKQSATRELKEETGLNIKKVLGVSNVVYSSPGLSDESSVMFFVEAEGEISKKYQEATEDIETFLYDINDIRNLLGDANKAVGAKAWGVLYYYSKIGEID